MEGGERAHLISAEELMRPDEEIPKQVRVFREIMNHFKRAIMATLEDEERTGEADLHEYKNLDSVIDRIQHLGNVLKLLINSNDIGKQANYMKEIDPILEAFEDRGFEFDQIDPKMRALYLYYIENDIDTYPYDLSPTHIDSITEQIRKHK